MMSMRKKYESTVFIVIVRQENYECCNRCKLNTLRLSSFNTIVFFFLSMIVLLIKMPRKYLRLYLNGFVHQLSMIGYLESEGNHMDQSKMFIDMCLWWGHCNFTIFVLLLILILYLSMKLVKLEIDCCHFPKMNYNNFLLSLTPLRLEGILFCTYLVTTKTHCWFQIMVQILRIIYFCLSRYHPWGDFGFGS